MSVLKNLSLQSFVPRFSGSPRMAILNPMLRVASLLIATVAVVDAFLVHHGAGSIAPAAGVPVALRRSVRICAARAASSFAGRCKEPRRPFAMCSGDGSLEKSKDDVKKWSVSA